MSGRWEFDVSVLAVEGGSDIPCVRASRGGLSVYDSHAFTTFSSADGLPERELAAVEVDAGGRVWTVTRSRPRVYRLAGGRWRALPALPERRANELATSMAVVDDPARGEPSIVVGTRAGGLWVWDGEAWTAIGERQGLPSA